MKKEKEKKRKKQSAETQAMTDQHQTNDNYPVYTATEIECCPKR
jgi:hypothetical protein